MSRKNPERQQLLAQVKARQRAAGKKVSRLKSNGVKVAGTNHDVRRPMDKVERYNTRQLRSYLGQLNTFTARTTRFFPDAHGNPLSPVAVARYKRAEKALNAVRKRNLDKIGDIKAPGAGGVTIRERLKINTPSRPRAVSAANPFTFVTRETKQIANEKALAKLTKDLESKLKIDFMKANIKAGRTSAEEMLLALRQPEMLKTIQEMSDFHFNVLWNGTSFAKDVSTPYHIAQSLIGKGSKSDKWMDDILEDNIVDSKQLIQDVLKIKPR